MKFIYLLLITIAAFQSDLTKAEAEAEVLPDDIEKCEFEDAECLRDQVQKVVNRYADSGIRSINLVPFDPLHLNRLKLLKNPNSPVSINLEFKDIDLYGLSKAEIQSVTGFDAEAKKPLEVKAFIPQLLLKGPYKIDGKVMILPVVGKGNSQIILDNLDIVLKLKSKLVTRSDEVHLEVVAVQLQIFPKRVTFNLEGLFHQDKALGDNMLTFMNENWEDIFSELKPDIQSALSLVFKQMLNNVFRKHPFSAYIK